MSDTTNCSANTPVWIEANLFNKVLRESGQNVKEIHNYRVFPALAPGENYSSTMLKVLLNIELEDGSQDSQTFMLKVPNKNQHLQEQWDAWQQFETEQQMYEEIIPAFEKAYCRVGEEVRFGAKSFQLDVEEKHILLEDLTKSGFKTLKRQNGLDMEHCKSVLRKMAQWHAASAVCKESYPTLLTMRGVLNENAKVLLDQMFNDCLKYTLKAIKKLPQHEQYYEKLENLSEDFAGKLRSIFQADDKEFNVLNHGDCWSNNIMFQYNSVGQLKSTYFVDFQVPLYGSPAMDLYYFILSSATLELKIDHFDEMIQYYHKHLVENLILLEYKNELPTLRCIHEMLLKYGIWGVFTFSGIMAGVLCESTDLSNIDHLAEESADAEAFKSLLFLNDRFVEHLSIIVPWLNSRGAFDY
ncbi:uncharacterized protein LOC133335435 [Musca vetustissima]|uniref:uncharacterized protein LOC133335435 n=1 Tax=Musca vetustissima TaxID=27455 RepID=UPI002AB6B077|nr:uncharacterized protein LOC133335435 [Musca vetustissima]